MSSRRITFAQRIFQSNRKHFKIPHMLKDWTRRRSILFFLFANSCISIGRSRVIERQFSPRLVHAYQVSSLQANDVSRFKNDDKHLWIRKRKVSYVEKGMARKVGQQYMSLFCYPCQWIWMLRMHAFYCTNKPPGVSSIRFSAVNALATLACRKCFRTYHRDARKLD
jgi:hypothetical protein